jgi:hypothetical protein
MGSMEPVVENRTPSDGRSIGWVVMDAMCRQASRMDESFLDGPFIPKANGGMDSQRDDEEPRSV